MWKDSGGRLGIARWMILPRAVLWSSISFGHNLNQRAFDNHPQDGSKKADAGSLTLTNLHTKLCYQDRRILKAANAAYAERTCAPSDLPLDGGRPSRLCPRRHTLPVLDEGRETIRKESGTFLSSSAHATARPAGAAESSSAAPGSDGI